MKKIGLLILLSVLVFVFAACGTDIVDADLNDEIVFGEWGGYQDISIEKQEDGSVWVVNVEGEMVLDVSDHPRTDILGDEFTGEPRLIKTYEVLGEMRYPDVTDEKGGMMTRFAYAYHYYDTFGDPLVENCALNLVIISGNYGITADAGGKGTLIYLKDGRKIEDVFRMMFTDAGVGVSNEGDTVISFYDDRFQELGSQKGIFCEGYVSDYVRNLNPKIIYNDVTLLSSGWGDGKESSYATLLDTYGYAPFQESDAIPIEVTEEVIDARTAYSDRVDAASGPRFIKDFLIVFANTSTVQESTRLGIVNDHGEILFPAEYLGFAYCDDLLIVFGEEQTELYDRESLTLKETLPFKMYCYDGKNAVVFGEDGLRYLTDEKGEILSWGCERIERFDMGENGVYYGGHFEGSDVVLMMDSNGKELFRVRNHPMIQYVGDGIFAVHSYAAIYSMDTKGKVLDVITLWDGYEYDENSGDFVYTGVKPEVREG